MQSASVVIYLPKLLTRSTGFDYGFTINNTIVL